MDSGKLLDALGDLAGSENARQEYAADKDGFLGAYGHPGLPADLVNEAVSHYADVADPTLAEQIAPTVMAHRGLSDTNATGDPDSGLDLLATAPIVDDGDPTADLDGGLATESDDPTADLDGDPATESDDPMTAPPGKDVVGGEPPAESASDLDDLADLAFGLGGQVDTDEEHDYGPDTDPVSSAAVDTAPLADISGTGYSSHELARVDGAQQPDEPWLGDTVDGDSA